MNSAIYEHAKDIVNAATGWQIGGIADLHPTVKSLVEKAVSAQVEFINANGGLDYFSDDTNSISLGSFSFSKTNNAGKSRPLLCRQAEMYLEQAGLMYRGAGVR